MLKNKLAVITGCNRGIGYNTLETLSAHGADIFACSRNLDKDFLKKTELIKEKFGNNIFPVKMDLSNKESVVEAAKKINDHDRNINILVNNAGVIHNKLFQLTKISEFKEVFEINFFNQVYFVQLLLRNIIKSKNGSIIFLSSSSASDGNIGRSVYSSSKAALVAFSKVLSREVGNYKIRVNSISPGLTDTQMMEKSTDKDYLTNIIKEIPLKRIGDPSDVSNLILFLASDLSHYITGQDLRIDGGLK